MVKYEAQVFCEIGLKSGVLAKLLDAKFPAKAKKKKANRLKNFSFKKSIVPPISKPQNGQLESGQSGVLFGKTL